ncbi:glutaminyl-peptide cyclotransferase [Allokutzneria albata]|uniref:Glutamine cyclotransferase n=1 Tax=Allokutzneria albata TaxID=211114 RepID=A0A1H0AY11_ALLAB|nr:glutaminyl-peptide cyclotransferase [Allokutzneria albata]SDN38279.1 Glutamine cyclotransferase [Allokutzneria albata]
MRRGSWRYGAAAAALVVVAGAVWLTEGDAPGGVAPERLRVQVLGALPHDTTAWTQGLELRDGVLYEGTGLAGQSSVRELDPATGAVRRQVPLPELFGEGVTVTGDRLWQLTWQEGVAIERDRSDLRELRRVRYPGEGWGLCLDGSRLVMSDGSSTLTLRDPATFAELGRVEVSREGVPVREINELECAGGAVWANLWKRDEIVRIDPASGAVTATVDASGLLSPQDRAGSDVLNGIAAIPGTDEFLITGKLWPKIFRVRFVPVR